MEKLLKFVKQLEMNVPNYAEQQKAISAANVGWHIEHSLLVFLRIISAMETSDPALYKSSFNLKKLLVYTLNKIPRGRAKAPKIVQPDGDIMPDKLLNNIEAATLKIKALANLHKHHHFDHPYFGKLNLKETNKFLAIHTNHHLKIIRDIMRAG